MKKFKHTKTNIEAKYVDGDYQLDSGHIIPAWLVENNRYEWREVTKEDYEILKWRYGDSWKVKDILSVKRLSDGLIVSISDYVENKRNPSYNGKVHKIEEDDGCMVYYKGKGWDYLNNIQKSRQPVLTLEDGVELFQGDKAYMIFINHPTPTISEITISDKSYIGLSYMKFFSTREAAEEYRLYNAKLLSLQDTFDADASMYTNSCYLKDLVKSRLKQ